MNLAVTYLSTDRLQHWPDVLVEVPPVDSGEGRGAECFEALGDAQVVPPANVFLVGVIGPRIIWDADDCFLDVDEAGLLQQLAGAMLVCDWARDPVGGVCEPAVPLIQMRVGREGVVVAARLHVDLDVLDPASAGFEVAAVIVSYTAKSKKMSRKPYVNIFWYSSGQLETLPHAMRKWIRSHESWPKVHGLS
jgi:hypothetical protein